MYKTPTNERKYHYRRGFIAATLLMALISVTAVTAVHLLLPAPDYTMTPEQYQGYVNACK